MTSNNNHISNLAMVNDIQFPLGTNRYKNRSLNKNVNWNMYYNNYSRHAGNDNRSDEEMAVPVTTVPAFVYNWQAEHGPFKTWVHHSA